MSNKMAAWLLPGRMNLALHNLRRSGSRTPIMAAFCRDRSALIHSQWWNLRARDDV
jgi:hypothetical protein